MRLFWRIFCKFDILFATNRSMKKLQYIIAFLVFGTFLSIQNPTEESETTINWITIEEALELQKKEPKK